VVPNVGWSNLYLEELLNATRGKKIWSTAEEEEWVRATHGVDTNAAMVVAAAKGRRKRRHCRLSSSLEEEKEEEAGE